MKLTKPQFREGIEWEKIPRSERNGRAWKYRAERNSRLGFEERICFGTYYLCDGNGDCWGVIAPHSITVMAGYAWNGSTCSPDWKVLLASMFHDLLYQFSGVAMFPFSRTFCDNLFFSLAESPLSPLYRIGLLVGGWTCYGQHEPGAHIIYQ